MRTRRSPTHAIPMAAALSGIAAAVVIACVVPACTDDPVDRGPAPDRIAVEPDWGELLKADPQNNLPAWKRSGSFVLSDDREAHALQPGVEFALPLPPGERACETAINASFSREDARNRQVTVELWVEEDGARRPLLSKHLDAEALRNRWHTLEVDFGHALQPGSRLIARVSPDGGQAWPPYAKLALAQPDRSGAGDERPNLLIISVDTLRADHLRCYGYARDTSPNVDKLAARGVLFEQTQSSAPWTLPSYGTLFTSRNPTVHRAGIQQQRSATFFAPSAPDTSANDLANMESLAPDLPALAEILRDRGWATAGFHNNRFLAGKSGILRGFQRWIMYGVRADTAVDLALDWISRRRGAPWFAFVHAYDPHKPYTPPSPFDRKYADRAPEDVPGYPPELEDTRAQVVDHTMRQFMIDEYDGEIAWTDAQVGRLLDALAASGELEHTLVVFQADHGEEFWDHGGYEHGHTMYQELLHVPLILSFAGKLPAGVRVPARVGLIDVMPTLLDLLRVTVPETVEGVNLAPLWKGGKLPERELLSECLLYGEIAEKALVTGNEKVILRAGDAPRLFDLSADPHELNDLTPTRAARAGELGEKLMRRAKTLEAQKHSSSVRVFSPRDKDELQKGGYGGRGGGAPDPKKPESGTKGAAPGTKTPDPGTKN